MLLGGYDILGDFLRCCQVVANVCWMISRILLCGWAL